MLAIRSGGVLLGFSLFFFFLSHVFRFEDEFLAACVKEPTIIAPIFYLDPPTAGGSAFHDDSFVVDDNDPDAAFAAAVAVSRPPLKSMQT